MIDMIFESYNIRDTILTLLEGIAKARELYQNKYKTPMPKEVERALIRMNPKYADWIIRIDKDVDIVHQLVYKEHRYTDILRQFTDLVGKNIIKGRDADINQYQSIEQVFNKIQGLKDVETKSALERRVKATGRDVIWSNREGTIKVVRIKSGEASCYYGHDTKWCVSMRDEPEHWDEYYGDLTNLYFILNNTPSVYTNYDKIAVVVNKDGTFGAYNKVDVALPNSELNRYLRAYKIPKNIFTPFKVASAPIEELLDRLGIEDYTIRSDGKVDVRGGIGYVKELRKVKFGIVTEGFDCSHHNLTTLRGIGTPEEVGGGFSCSHNQLTTLEGAPKTVGRYFQCSNNKLVSLKGAPRVVGGHFLCNDNQLKTLEDGPQLVKGNFYCYNNPLVSKELHTKVDGYVLFKEIGGI